LKCVPGGDDVNDVISEEESQQTLLEFTQQAPRQNFDENVEKTREYQFHYQKIL
jgi:hypothetical protein